MPAIPKDLWRALKEIMPTDDFMICKVHKRGDAYIVYAEDKEYHYRVEVSLKPHTEDDYHYRLLDFSYQEKYNSS